MTIELELVALGFFYYRRESFWSKNENLPMTSELNLPTESFSGIQTNVSLVETRASVVTLVTQAAEPSLLEMWPHVSTLLDQD